MIDFTPLFKNPVMIFFGAAAQFGIFATMLVALALGFDLKPAAAIGIIGALTVRQPFMSQTSSQRNSWTDIGGGLFVHVAGADHPASCDQAPHNKEGTLDQNGIP
jgi:hypothetical protein